MYFSGVKFINPKNVSDADTITLRILEGLGVSLSRAFDIRVHVVDTGEKAPKLTAGIDKS